MTISNNISIFQQSVTEESQSQVEIREKEECDDRFFMNSLTSLFKYNINDSQISTFIKNYFYAINQKFFHFIDDEITS